MIEIRHNKIIRAAGANLNGVIFPIIRKLSYGLIAQNMFVLQPLPRPSRFIFYYSPHKVCGVKIRNNKIVK